MELPAYGCYPVLQEHVSVRIISAPRAEQNPWRRDQSQQRAASDSCTALYVPATLCSQELNASTRRTLLEINKKLILDSHFLPTWQKQQDNDLKFLHWGFVYGLQVPCMVELTKIPLDFERAICVPGLSHSSLLAGESACEPDLFSSM